MAGPQPRARAGVGSSSPSTIKDNEIDDSSHPSFYTTENLDTGTKTLHHKNENERYPSPQEDLSVGQNRESKTKMIRRKMMEARRKRSQQKMKDGLICRKAGGEKKSWNGHQLISAKDVKNEEIQNSLEMVIIGADVQALYPSLADVEVAILCYDAVMKSSIRFDNINYRKASQYIAMNLTKEEQTLSNLQRVLPIRTAKGGVRPCVSAKTDNEENWRFPLVEYTDLEKKRMIATIVQIGVLVMMNTHLYSFNGKTFIQQGGGPIGLRSTCAVARVVMNEWDAKWMEKLEENNVKVRKSERYMDDIRAFLKALKEGWRWFEGGFWFCEAWRNEDINSGKSNCKRTGDALLGSMNDIMNFLVFTLEIHEDFEDLKLPTLDTLLYMEDGRIIHFEFFQKPMSTNLVLQADTALSDSLKMASLKEEVVRRLKYTSERLGFSKRLGTLEDLCQRMTNIGHKLRYMKQILIAGIMRFEAKLKNSKLKKDDPTFTPTIRKK